MGERRTEILQLPLPMCMSGMAVLLGLAVAVVGGPVVGVVMGFMVLDACWG